MGQVRRVKRERHVKMLLSHEERAMLEHIAASAGETYSTLVRRWIRDAFAETRGARSTRNPQRPIARTERADRVMQTERECDRKPTRAPAPRQ